ncbi:class I SAM-dependent methyltransferase [Nitrosopumilus sp. b2]|uniref:class I SAM-dependent methyltransferase n=1 Tax=Nitrosopumilus sp. b2 TaxID=2109908 RepID=UPI0015F77720|nr:class I SAM-dependent methyltransferase [Nitrosopumilus sp. b2]KAF6245780.1 hypothetical protein C6989_01190 [Nitrosopumilus sp. b2]
MEFKNWPREKSLISGQEYLGNQLIAQNASSKGYETIINEYVYIDTKYVSEIFKKIPKVWDKMKGIGVDLGGGVGCISSTIARKEDVKKIFCVELVEDVVKLCQPIVKKEILGENYNKVISVVGSFDNLELEENSIDFAVSWDSMHHSSDLVKTLTECKRVLKKDSILVIVDRAHNNSTPDSEIERMLNIVYDEEFLIKNYRPKDTILTRRENGEHEYRIFEWKNFFKQAGYEILDNIIIKTSTDENKKLKNDDNISEIFVDYELGAFGNRKIMFVLKPIK